MTRVCLVGDPDVTLQYELLSRETSRDALSTYDLERPFENSLAVHTVSVGSAVSLCNDLQWYIVRFVDDVLIQEPSVSETEWLSRSLALALRNGELEPEATGEYLKIYGVETTVPGGSDGYSGDGPNSRVSPAPADERRRDTRKRDATDADGDDETDTQDPADSGAEGVRTGEQTRRLVEPLYVRRIDGDVPEYDLRDVDETVVVRLTEAEYGP